MRINLYLIFLQGEQGDRLLSGTRRNDRRVAEQFRLDERDHLAQLEVVGTGQLNVDVQLIFQRSRSIKRQLST